MSAKTASVSKKVPEWRKGVDFEDLSRQDAIVILANATSTRSYGIARKLNQYFPYAVLAENRKSLSFAPSRAHWRDRNICGEVIKLSDPENKGPDVYHLINAFAPGASVEDNTYHQKVLLTSKDHHYKSGIKKDSALERRGNFDVCCQRLMTLLKHEVPERIFFMLPVHDQREEFHSTWQPEFETIMTDNWRRLDSSVSRLILCLKPTFQEYESILKHDKQETISLPSVLPSLEVVDTPPSYEGIKRAQAVRSRARSLSPELSNTRRRLF